MSKENVSESVAEFVRRNNEEHLKVSHGKPNPDRYELEKERYDRLELLAYDLCILEEFDTERRDERLSKLDLMYGYTRGSDEFLELEEFYLRVYYELPFGEDNLWYWGIKVCEEDLWDNQKGTMGVINPDWENADGENIFEYAAARAYQVFIKVGNLELAAELKKWYLDITDPSEEANLLEPYIKINW